jgi:hypothetical protein
MTGRQPVVRTYGGWRRARGVGLWGLGPAATLVLLGCFAALILAAAFSTRALVYAGPLGVLVWAAALARVDSVPVALLVARHVRWWYGTRAGHTTYHPHTVRQLTGTLHLPGVLAATELLPVPDAHGGRYGLVRDQHTGYLTATLRVAPASPWLADPDEADGWVANWAAWLASLGHQPAVRWVTVTVETAPDPGAVLTRHAATALDLDAPRPAVELLDQVVAAAPMVAAQVATWVSITLDPAALPSRPRDAGQAATGAGQVLTGLEAALGLCGVSVLGRARPVELAAIVRAAFDPAVRGQVHRLLAAGAGPAVEQRLRWASAGPAHAEEHWDRYAHDSGVSVSWAWREAPRQHVTATVLAPLLGPGRHIKRVSVQYRPMPAAVAARALDGQVRAAEFRHEYSRRTRRDVTARDAHDHAHARQAADEEARGAGAGLLGVYVTVTVTDPAQLPAAVADTEAAAAASKVGLRRLDGSHAAGFAATLPCGICLPELARRTRH